VLWIEGSVGYTRLYSRMNCNI